MPEYDPLYGLSTHPSNSVSPLILTVLAVKYVEDPVPAMVFDDVDNGLCVKWPHVEHVTVVLSGNINRYAGSNVGHVEYVCIGSN